VPLRIYFDILKGKLSPRYLVAAQMPSGLDAGGAAILSLDELFRRHRELIKPFFENPSPQINERFSKGELSLLQLKALIARRMLEECMLCENRCRVNRLEGKRGRCRVGEKSFYASEFLHIGEEPELVPSHTVFFTGCTFECIYCQNWDIAHGKIASMDGGYPADESLVRRIVSASPMARNLNLVGGDPGGHLATIMNLLVSLAHHRYSRPIVWNSNMYQTPEAVELLAGVIDVHLADFKYGSNEHGKMLSGIERYWDTVTRNLLAVKPVAEILIRHLVIPSHVECCTAKVTRWVGENLPEARFNLMFQYHPEYRADERPEINRYLTESERRRARELAEEAGLEVD